MFDKEMICEDGFKNIYENGEAVGFQLQVRICYYRGISITLVDRFEIKVDGEVFASDKIKFGVKGKLYSFSELDQVEYNSVRWEFGEKAILFVSKPGGLTQGSHEVFVRQSIMVHYFPNQRSVAEYTKMLVLVMDRIRIGVIGVGNIGSHHVKYLNEGRVKDAVLTAVCDTDPSRLEWVENNIGAHVRCFDNYDDLLASGLVDGIIIAVPHYLHPPYAISAFAKGIHVISEKPTGVYTRQVREMNEAANRSSVVFAAMFNQRTTPVYKKVKEMMDAGEIGEMRRVNYTVTSTYRPQAYHNSSSWRGTWAGEGGGALINQYAHKLDLWQKMCGVPLRIRGFCSFGKRRSIEVEDEVTAYAEYANGATGLLICSTTECPGTDRLEIAGDRGKIVVEDLDKLTFYRCRESENEFNLRNKTPFAQPEVWTCDVPINENFVYFEGHIKVTQNWVNHILHSEPLLSPGQEGINMVQIMNAIYLSSWTDSWVDLPIDDDLYYDELQKQIKNSSFVKPEVVKIFNENMTRTF